MKENLGIELIQSRYEGLTEVVIEVEAQQGFRFDYNLVASFDLKSTIHTQETLDRQEQEVYNELRKFLAMNRIVLTVMGRGETRHDTRCYYRISNRFDDEVELRPFQNDKFEVINTERLGSKRKATNFILKAIQEVVKEIKKNNQE